MIRVNTSTRGEFSGGGNLLNAIKKALRETMKDSKKTAAQAIKRRYLKPTLGTKPLKVSVRGLTGSLKTQGSRNPLQKFKVKPASRKNPPPKSGVFAQVLRSGGDYLSKAFFAYRDNRLFQRESPKRLPIKYLRTVSAPSMLKVHPVSSAVISKIETEFNKNLERQVASIL